MILDGHVHIGPGAVDCPGLAARLKAANVAGALLISPAPPCFGNKALTTAAAVDRLDSLFAWCQASDSLYPFFWIDPLEADAVEQVHLAVERGVMGFKIICSHFYPQDERSLEICQAIATAGKPVLFHSGILWDCRNSANYNRPGNFEALLEIEGLRFSLAHISWPWCDECIAVYGKFQNALQNRDDLSVEMFVDTTPGTPPIDRPAVLTKLFKGHFDPARHVIFGSDAMANDYSVAWVKEWLERDGEIYQELGLTETVTNQIFGGNLRRFVGL